MMAELNFNNFDTTELVSFFIAFIAMIIIIYLFFLIGNKSKKINKKTDKQLDKYSIRLVFFIFLFIFLNRFFTNVEAIAYKTVFNLLEHLSSLAAGLTAIVFSWNGIRGGKNRK